MDWKRIAFSTHAVRRMWQRRIHPDAVLSIIRNNVPFLRYPGARPYPKFLLLGYAEQVPIHVVVARNDDAGCVVVTVYFPEPDKWESDLQSRRPR